MLYQREIEIRQHVDVLVAGGGPSGIAAAISAAELGKKVYLVEGTGCFGGMATNAYVPLFMRFSDGKHFLCGDVAKRILKSIAPNLPDNLFCYGFDVEKLKAELDTMIEQCGIQFSFFTEVIDVICEEKRIKQVILNAKSGMFAIEADVVIDCTGNADLAAFAGVPFLKGDEFGNMMAPSLWSVWTHIGTDAKMMDQSLLEKALANNEFSTWDAAVPGMFRLPDDEGTGIGAWGHCFGGDGTDENSITRIMVEGRRKVREYEQFYRNHLKTGYEKMFLCATAPYPGIRETRRIIGDYTITLNDYLARACFEDEIGRYYYPAHIHVTKPGEEEYRSYTEESSTYSFKPGETFGIPYRSLTTKEIENLIVAGRCISADRYVLSSIRVMPCCMLMGQAAGTAAAITSNGNVHDIDINKLREILRLHDVYLPEYHSC